MSATKKILGDYTLRAVDSGGNAAGNIALTVDGNVDFTANGTTAFTVAGSDFSLIASQTFSDALVANASAFSPYALTTRDFVETLASPLTTKGDLFTFDTANARLPVGTNGYLLRANSSTTTGLEWSAGTGSSPLTTKGDIYTFDTSDTRLPIGTDGYVLTANSAASTGISWETAGGSVTLSDTEIGYGNGSAIVSDSDFIRNPNQGSFQIGVAQADTAQSGDVIIRSTPGAAEGSDPQLVIWAHDGTVGAAGKEQGGSLYLKSGTPTLGNSNDLPGGTIYITAGDGADTNGDGGTVEITGGVPSGTGIGGTINLWADPNGTPGTINFGWTGDGVAASFDYNYGYLVFYSSAVGDLYGIVADDAVDTDAGELDLYSGNATGTGNAGSLYIGGGSAATGNGGDIYIDGGPSTSAGNGGSIIMTSGHGANVGGLAGNIELSTNQAAGGGDGGRLYLHTSFGVTSGNGGPIDLAGGAGGGTAGNGGPISLTGGDATAGNGNGGSITFTAGDGVGTGFNGNIELVTQSTGSGGGGVVNAEKLGKVGEQITTANISSSYDINLNKGNTFDLTLTANTTITFSNAYSSGTAHSFTVILRQAGFTASLPTTQWAGNTPPTLSNATDILSFMTVDGGSTWFGFPGGLNFA